MSTDSKIDDSVLNEYQGDKLVTEIGSSFMKNQHGCAELATKWVTLMVI